VKKHLEIIRELGLIILLLISVGVTAASDEIPTTSVTIKQVSVSEEGDLPIVNTYNDIFESTETHIRCGISGGVISIITDEVDTIITEIPDPIVSMPKIQIGQPPEKFTDELSTWISFKMDNMDQSLTIDDFSQDISSIIESKY